MLVVRGRHEKLGLAVTVERDGADVPTLSQRAIEKSTSVRRHRGRTAISLANELVARLTTLGRDAEHVKCAIDSRRVENLGSVGRPSWVHRSSERQAAQNFRLKLQNPDVQAVVTDRQRIRIVNFKPLSRARAAIIRLRMICSASVGGVEVISRR